MKEYHKKRLRKLASMLIADANNKRGLKFDLGMVGRIPIMGGKKEDVTIDCGTTGCAMGLAAMSGEFEECGLSFVVRADSFWVDTTINGQTEEYDTAAQKVFGISNRAANYLFTPCNYPDDKRRGAEAEIFVANRIRRFAAGKVSRKTIMKVEC